MQKIKRNFTLNHMRGKESSVGPYNLNLLRRIGADLRPATIMYVFQL